jgi:hypothetical protein
VASTPKRAHGLGAVVAGAHGDAFLVQGLAHFLGV